MTVELFLGSVPPRRRAAALYEQLREAIATGRLVAGDRLPTSRELAADVGVSRSTVTTVYGRLVAEGHANGRVGDGTFVAEDQDMRADTVAGPGRRSGSEGAGHRWGASPRESQATADVRGALLPATAVDAPWRVDLRTGRPDPRLFPVVAWRRCAVSAMQAAPPGYGNPAGLPELRRALAAWVSRSRGVHTSAEHVVVTAGAQGAFDLLARTLGRGATVAVEDPGYPPAARALRAAGLRLAPVPVDADGLVVDHLPKRVDAVYTTPSHQAPTGAVLANARRRQLLDVARRRDLLVIEDDYDTEYRYVDRPLEPLQRLAPECVAYVGSFSKTVTPSLRIGFVVAPPTVAGALVAARAAVDTQPPFLTQAALAAFVTSGELERHLRRTRRVYRLRRNHLVARLDELVERGVLAGHDPCLAGLHATVTLPGGVEVAAVVAVLRERGVAVNDTSAAWLGPTGRLLELGFGLADEPALDAGLAELTTVLARLRRRRRDDL